MRHLLALILSLLPLAFGQTPFPIAFKIENSAQSSAFSFSVNSYFSSVEQQSSFTSFAAFMATATDLTEAETTEFSLADNEPLIVCTDFFGATETPAWYTDMPTPYQNFVSSVASVEASIATKVLGGAAGRVEAKVAVMGSLLATMLAVMLLL